MATVSIIIPIYNAESFVAECVRSIQGQTFDNWELILVNDGSTDRSVTICESFVRTDSRIRLLNKKNGGVSSARNLGLSEATGKYISFVDADDKVTPDYIEELLKPMSVADLTVDKCTVVYGDKREIKEDYVSLYCSEDNFTEVFSKGMLFRRTSPWGKLYRRDIIEKSNIRFNESVNLGEDAIFLFTYVLECQTVSFIDNGGYLYRFEVPESLTKRTHSLESEVIGATLIGELCDSISSVPVIIENEIKGEIERLKGYYTRRILNALYYNDIKRNIRINKIKELPLQRYIESYPVDSIKEKIYKYLLKHRLYHIYDAIRLIISKKNKK